MGRRSIICLAVATAMLLVTAPAAAAAQLPPPGGFKLAASNGYSLLAFSYDGESRGGHDSLFLYFRRKGSAVLYIAQKGVQVTEDSIAADLGELGVIDLRFVPAGQPRDEAPRCDPQQTAAVDSGGYEGRIDFEGEEGFTTVHATRARGSAEFVVDLICSSQDVEGVGGRAPGAQLRVHRRGPGGSVDFEAWKNSPSRPAWFKASIEERRGAIAIFRDVSSKAGPRSFEFDVPAQSARLRPPSPFGGSGRFARVGKGRGRLDGRLSVDFPGRSDVSLTGTRGSLMRYVKNPSHPFRLERK